MVRNATTTGGTGLQKSQMTQLQSMGFDAEQARKALTTCAWDVNRALDHLISTASLTDAREMDADGELPVVSLKVLPVVPVSEDEHVSGLGAESVMVTPISSPRSSNPTEEVSTAEPLCRTSASSIATSTSPRDGACDAEEFTPAPSVLRLGKTPPLDSITLASLEMMWAAERKQVMHVAFTWSGELTVSSPLAVEAGTFVVVWPQSRVDHGWVYAEHLSGNGQAGWLPCSVLQPLLPENEKYMRAAKGANPTHDAQLYFEAGSFLRINTSSCTNEGWVFGGLVDDAQHDAASGQCCTGGIARTGWLSMDSLEC